LRKDRLTDHGKNLIRSTTRLTGDAEVLQRDKWYEIRDLMEGEVAILSEIAIDST
jgi:hypothetical protein